jgi:hypothetical protein
MKIVIDFPTLNGLLDEHGEPAQDKGVLSEWLKGQLWPRFSDPKVVPPREYTIQQVLDDRPTIVSLPEDWTEERVKQFEANWDSLMKGSKLTFVPNQP